MLTFLVAPRQTMGLLALARRALTLHRAMRTRIPSAISVEPDAQSMEGMRKPETMSLRLTLTGAGASDLVTRIPTPMVSLAMMREPVQLRMEGPLCLPTAAWAPMKRTIDLAKTTAWLANGLSMEGLEIVMGVNRVRKKEPRGLKVLKGATR
jgi:hypothetical protein